MKYHSTPILPVVVVGKDRTRMTCAVVDALYKHIKNASPYFICVSDRSRDGHDRVVENHLKKIGLTNYKVLRTLPEENRYGWGAAINIGLSCAFDLCKEATCALVVDNDWILQRDLDIEKYLYAFEYSDIGAITFKAINAGTNIAIQETPLTDGSKYLIRHPAQEKGRFSFTAELGCALITKNLYTAYGKFKENCRTDETEWDFCNWYNGLEEYVRSRQYLWFATDKELFHTVLNGAGHVFTHVGLNSQHEGPHKWDCPEEYRHLSDDKADEQVCKGAVKNKCYSIEEASEDETEEKIKWDKYFDKVYCTFLLGDKNPRLPRLLKELRRVNLLDSPVFSWRYDVITKLDAPLIEDKGWTFSTSAYKKHCYNYIRILKESYLLGMRRIMIIEDDIAFLKDKREIIRKLDSLPDNPIVQMDKAVLGEKNILLQQSAMKLQEDYIVSNSNFTLATCMIFGQKGMQLFITTLESKKCCVDEIGNYLKNNEIAVAVKPLAIQIGYQGCCNSEHNPKYNHVHQSYARQGIDRNYSEYAVPDGYNMEGLYQEKEGEGFEKLYDIRERDERQILSKKGRKFVSVYAIAKNESSVAKRWYECVKEADEVCVLDTGSTDNTVKILRDLGAKVSVKTYDDWSFAVARNDSMKLVSPDSEILFTLDLDETIAPGWRKKLEDAWIAEEEKENNPVGAAYKYVWSFYEDGREMQSFSIRKIHKNGVGRWKYRCHELLQEVNGYSFFINDFVVEHHQNKETSRSKYFSLLEKDAKEMPQDDRSAYYYARELKYNGRLEDAISEFKRHLSLPSAGWICERASSMRNIAYCYIQLKNEEASELWLWKAAEEDKTNREATFFLGKMALDRKDYRTAVKVLERCVAIEKPSLEYISMPIVWTAQPWLLYAQALWWTGDWVKAVKASQKALEIEPNNEEVKAQLNGMSMTARQHGKI